MAKLRIGATDYTLTSAKVSSPALKLINGGVTSYGFLTTTKPTTKTLKIGPSHYLNQPRVPFTITLPISLSASAGGALAYSAYLTQLNAYGATWSFSGVAWQNKNDWKEASSNHGEVRSVSTRIEDIGHSYQYNTSQRAVGGSGTLKTDSETLANVSQRVSLKGVGIHQYTTGSDDNERTVTVSPTTYVTGTLTITGYKLP